MSEFEALPNSHEEVIDDLAPYIEHIFGTPRPAGSQPLILDGPAGQVATEVDIFRVLASVFSQGIVRLYGDAKGNVPLKDMTSEHVDHVRKCFQATGYDFLLDPPQDHASINKCVPVGQPRMLQIPKRSAAQSATVNANSDQVPADKCEMVTVMFYPL